MIFVTLGILMSFEMVCTALDSGTVQWRIMIWHFTKHLSILYMYKSLKCPYGQNVFLGFYYLCNI